MSLRILKKTLQANKMDISSDPIVIVDEIMIPIHLKNGSFEVNEEVMPVIHKVIEALGLVSVEDLTEITEEEFMPLFSPLLNSHFGLE